MREKILSYTSDVMKEMNKVTWPTKQELKDSTVIVSAVCLILSLFIFGIDNLISFVITSIF